MVVAKLPDMLVGHALGELLAVLKAELFPIMLVPVVPCPWLVERERLGGLLDQPMEPMLEGAGEPLFPQGLESIPGSEALHGLEELDWMVLVVPALLDSCD